ncbi:MAG: transposase [Granulicella sp.]
MRSACLLKLYLYGYLNQLRSSRRLEAECRSNVELMWLVGRLYPDHKSIAEFRRMHRLAVTNAGAALVRFARSCGLIRGEWIVIDGGKFRAVANGDSVRDRDALRRYLDVVSRSLDDDALNCMNARATPDAMRLRRTTVEHPFGTIKYHIFGHPRLLLRGVAGARTEISIAIMAYNLKRIAKVFGAMRLPQALAPA